MSYNCHDVVVVPSPFTDRASTKRRPALVISDAKVFNKPCGHLVLAMITSAKNSGWPLDVEIMDPDTAGLTAASVVRMKLFTLDEQLIIRRVGSLADADQLAVQHALIRLLGNALAAQHEG